MDTEERYEVVKDSHGRGGFGKVSKHRDKFLDRFVAVKELHLSDDVEAQERFERESKTLAKMSHPNIPAIYDVKFSNEAMLIYFEFLDGNSLQELISHSSFPTMEEARRWFLQVASALDHSHALGIVHRDLKPANIIISEDRHTASLVDFGIALTAGDVQRITKSGYAIGTAGYMSPEQMAGEEVDGRSDLYSLGIALYATLSGQLPQPGDYRPLAEANEAIPPSIDDLIKNCLESRRSQRIESAAAFSRQLKGALRTDVPFSILLTEGRLHEVCAALSSMSHEDYNSKPRGQRLLIVNRLKDLMRIDKPQLKRPTAELISLLVQLARLEPKSDYKIVTDAALEWGFEQVYGEKWQGQQEVRDGILEAAKSSSKQGLGVLSESFLNFVSSRDLTGLQGWFLHDVRAIAMAILANPKCEEVQATRLAEIYDRANEVSHAPAK